MKSTTRRTIAGFALGTILATSGIALAAAPAHAAVSVTTPNTQLENSAVAVDVGQSWYDLPKYEFDAPVSKVTYTVTGEGSGVDFTDSFADVLGIPWDANNQFLWAGSASGGLY